RARPPGRGYYNPKDRDRLICWRHASSASASLPYLSPDQDESRETASSTGENAVHPKQPHILVNQRLACVVAGLVQLACLGFHSHALPPPTSRNSYCWGASSAPVSS